MEKQQKCLFMIGNPLLDISVECPDSKVLDKYELQHGQASLASEKQAPALYNELWDMPGRQAIPGGSALNSARSANYMLKNNGHAKQVTYFGSIADDDKGKALEDCLVEEGVNGNFHKCTSDPTGTCAVVVVK